MNPAFINPIDAILRLEFLQPSTPTGALFYAAVFIALAHFASRLVHAAFNRAIQRDTQLLLDQTVLQFLSQFVRVVIYILAIIFYVHLIPQLNHLGTALLTSVSVVSVVIGLAAQPTLGNLISGIALVLYRPFNVGDKVQISAPTGVETTTVERLTLGYTILRTQDNRRIIVPNNLMASQVVVNVTNREAPAQPADSKKA